MDCTAFHGVGTRQGKQSWGSSPGAGLVLPDGRGAARLRGRTQARPAGGGQGEAAVTAPFRAGRVVHLQPGQCRQSAARGAHRPHPWHLRFSPAFPQWMGQRASTPPAAKLSRSIPNARALRRAVSLAPPTDHVRRPPINLSLSKLEQSPTSRKPTRLGTLPPGTYCIMSLLLS